MKVVVSNACRKQPQVEMEPSPFRIRLEAGLVMIFGGLPALTDLGGVNCGFRRK